MYLDSRADFDFQTSRDDCQEYEDTGSLKDSTRRLMVNIIVDHMREKEV